MVEFNSLHLGKLKLSCWLYEHKCIHSEGRICTLVMFPIALICVVSLLSVFLEVYQFHWLVFLTRKYFGFVDFSLFSYFQFLWLCSNFFFLFLSFSSFWVYFTLPFLGFWDSQDTFVDENVPVHNFTLRTGVICKPGFPGQIRMYCTSRDNP